MMDSELDIVRAKLRRHRVIAIDVDVIAGIIDIRRVVTTFVVFVVFVVFVIIAVVVIFVFAPAPLPATAVLRVALAFTCSFSFSVAVVRMFSSLAASPTRP